jgi:hypothetical protein
MMAALLYGVVASRRSAFAPAAAFAIACLSLAHSTVDFTLQAPGYSIPFFALFGVGLASSFRAKSAAGA